MSILPNLRRDSESKPYFAEGDLDPFCPVCMYLDSKQTSLQPVRSSISGAVLRYDCKECQGFFTVRF